MVGALIQGFHRSAFSNEAGLGSASIAHAAVMTREPVTEGFVALWEEPFIDTVVICWRWWCRRLPDQAQDGADAAMIVRHRGSAG
jgi:hypothetical protein